jgi:hypothetical protein
MSGKKFTLKIEITEEEKEHLESLFMRDSVFIIRQEKACSRKRDYLSASIWKQSSERSNVLFLKILRGVS